MGKERFSIFPEEIVGCLKDGGIKVVEFNINYSDELLFKPIQEYLPVIVSELTDNCLDKGAKKILISLQSMAYYMAVYLNNNVDKPHNIAKSVTVK